MAVQAMRFGRSPVELKAAYPKSCILHTWLTEAYPGKRRLHPTNQSYQPVNNDRYLEQVLIVLSVDCKMCRVIQTV